MLNFLIRYQPIVRHLQGVEARQVLEIGSGPEGLALFWRGDITGADVHFKRTPLHRPLMASSLSLPFAANTWPVVISCDMLEHLPQHLRHNAVVEIARVAGDILLLGFPSGAAAQACYQNLAERVRGELPNWLADHIRYGLPDAVEVAQLLEAKDWQVQSLWYESAKTHERLVHWETKWPLYVITYALMRLFGPWLIARWPFPQASKPLRVLLVARRMIDGA